MKRFAIPAVGLLVVVAVGSVFVVPRLREDPRPAISPLIWNPLAAVEQPAPVPIPFAGRVVDEVGGPVEGAAISIFPAAPGAGPVRSDARGAFRLSAVSVALGTWLHVLHPGSAPTRVHTPSLDPRDAAIRLSRGVPLRGVVRTREGRDPVPDARVVVSAPALMPLTARTDGDGRFAFPAVPADSAFHLIVDAGPLGWTELPPTKPAADAVLTVPLPPIRTLPGRVVTDLPSGRRTGVGGVRVASRVKAWLILPHAIWEDGEREEGPGAVSDEDGNFVLAGITRPGALWIDSSDWVASPAKLPFTLNAPQVVVRVRRRTLTAADPTLPETTIVGRIVDEDGRPVPGATVDVEQDLIRRGKDAPRMGRARTGPDGRFRLAVLDQDCRIEITAFGRARLVLRRVPVVADPTDLGDLVLAGLPARIGRVVTGTGEPLPTASVSLGWKARYRPVDPDGRFRIEPPRKAPFLFRVRAPGRVPRTFTREEVPAFGEWSIVLAPLHVVTGVVLGPDGEPVPGVRFEGDTWITTEPVTDVAGRFRLGFSSGGTVRLRPVAPGLDLPETTVETGRNDVVIRAR